MGCAFSREGTINAVKADANTENPLVLRSPFSAPQSPELILHERSKHLVSSIIVDNRTLNIRDFYDFERTPILGTGISGTVKVCIHKQTRVSYALKTLHKNKVKASKLSQLREEVNTMADLDHPNIIRVQEVFEEEDFIHLVLDLCRGGELLDRLHEQRESRYCEREACQYVYTILSTVKYCHVHHVVHRDLKLENFLFEDESKQSTLKLIDFGLSRHFGSDEVMHRSVGSPYYISPEVLAGKYNEKCDIWSVGVIAYMLLAGTPPFYGKTNEETLSAVRKGNWSFHERDFKDVSSAAKGFVIFCLNTTVDTRPSAEEALRHPWFDLLKTEREGEGGEEKDMSHTFSLDVIERIRGFQKRTALAKVCLEVVAHCLLPEQIADLRKEFAKYDLKQEGEISLADLHAVLSTHTHLTEEEIVRIFKDVDIDHAGAIQYHEFLAAAMSRQVITEENMRLAFERIGNRSERITVQNLCVLLDEERSGEEVADIMKEIRSLPSENIDYPQFKKIMLGSINSPLVKRRMTFIQPDDSSQTLNTQLGSCSYSYSTATASDMLTLPSPRIATTDEMMSPAVALPPLI